MDKERWLLGYLKGTSEPVYLFDFKFECNWDWGGGYIGNNKFHAHFDGAFLNTIDPRGHCLNSKFIFMDPWQIPPSYAKKENIIIVQNGASVWEDLKFFLDDPQYSSREWWRIKDLFKQFYSLKAAAETFQFGGHCTSEGRNPAELNKEMADKINHHIETVIIPETRKILNKEADL